MKLKNIIKAAFAFALCFTVLTNVNVDAKVDRSARISSVAPAMVAGELEAFATEDTYITLGEVSGINAGALLSKSSFEAHYSITGDEESYYSEYADSDLNVLANQRVKFNAADMSALNNATAIGHYKVRGTYTNQELVDAGFSGVVNFEINVNVVGPNSVYVAGNADSPVAVLNVKNFKIKLDDAKALTTTSVKNVAASELKAWDSSVAAFDGMLLPGKDLKSIVKVDEAQLAKITSATKGGAYDLTYTLEYYAGYSISKTVKVYVVGENTSENDGLIMYSDDFTITAAKAKVATSAELVKLANVKVYDIESGEQMSNDDVTIDPSSLHDVAKTLTTKSAVVMEKTKTVKLSVVYSKDARKVQSTVSAIITYTTESGGGGTDEPVEPPVLPGPTEPKVPVTGMDNTVFAVTGLLSAISLVLFTIRKRLV